MCKEVIGIGCSLWRRVCINCGALHPSHHCWCSMAILTNEKCENKGGTRICLEHMAEDSHLSLCCSFCLLSSVHLGFTRYWNKSQAMPGLISTYV